MRANETDIEVFGKPECEDFLRAEAVLKAVGVPFRFHDISVDADAAAEAQRISGGTSSPVVTFPDGSFVVEPDDADLAARLR